MEGSRCVLQPSRSVQFSRWTCQSSDKLVPKQRVWTPLLSNLSMLAYFHSLKPVVWWGSFHYAISSRDLPYSIPHTQQRCSCHARPTSMQFLLCLDYISATSMPSLLCPYLGDYCIQNFHLGRYFVEYTVGNLVLWRRVSGAVKRDFRTYIRRYTSPNEIFEYGYPFPYEILQFRLKLKRCKPHNAARHSTKCGVINDVKLFPTVYRRIYWRKFLTFPNQKSRYKSKCIRIRSYCAFTSIKTLLRSYRFQQCSQCVLQVLTASIYFFEGVLRIWLRVTVGNYMYLRYK